MNETLAGVTGKNAISVMGRIDKILAQNMIRQVLRPQVVRNDKKDVGVEARIEEWWNQFQDAASRN